MLYIPTRSDIEALQTGNMAIDCFGHEAEIVSEVYRGADIYGKLFASYYTQLSNNAMCSMSMKEDELVRHVGTSAKFTSHQLDLIEAEMLANNERIREL